MALGKFLDPRNDFSFKRIFGTERNKDILIHFLNDVLVRPSPIEDLTFLQTIQEPEIASLRNSIVDVMYRDQKGNRFVIEMQLARQEAFDRRALYYAARAYCSRRVEGTRFEDLKDIYVLAITNFAPFPEKKTWLSHIGLKDLNTNEHDIEAIQLFFMQLPLFKKTSKDLETMTTREKWAYFFKYASETTEKDLEKIVGQDAIIKKAYDELDRFSWSQAELDYYDSIEIKKLDDEATRKAARKEGHEEGREEGREEEKERTARTMLKIGLPIEQISEVTGLSERDIESLRE